MKTIGFIKSTMPEEKRVGLLPSDVKKIRHPEKLFFEKGYAEHICFSDDCYREAGAKIISRREMRKMDVICAPKRWATDKKVFSDGQALWGWLYVAHSPWLAKALVEKKMTGIAFEYMYHDTCDYVFPENRRITGIAGMMQALPYVGKPPELLKKVALLGNGKVGAAVRLVLDKNQVQYEVFNSKNVSEFFLQIRDWEMIINCIKWDKPGQFLITRRHISKMKPAAFIVDITTEGIQGSRPQSIYSPVYNCKQVKIYNNEHIPTLWAGYASEKISEALVPFVNDIVEELPNIILQKATVVLSGTPLDKRIDSLLNNNCEAKI
ncbi:Alanine dehydrogenase [uncultured archaeon]|nr:Alanine dehydrogenase [uncultured archaeon]